ncbi:TipAS antibiotic-recognition protein [Kribbella amoyensis]|uniref:TipAS antibiotic-recognition protein n=1 Tax=Kribbella amoyensis TaxID=996641 RepID=A0A561BUL3_9ACTN|nr:TipAS antibiotic-recognition domain-containing protein [Kribbella amoyensis]TWD82538.1 TipAS antibiotic-recognition protein [Kribbella amoyensis]
MTRRIQSPLSDAEKQEVWGDFADQAEASFDEVERRWGDSPAYAESARRVARYGKAEWQRINADGAVINTRIAELMDAGVGPDSEDAMDVAEAQRLHVSRWFYPMDHEFHVAKSVLYVQDPRFREGLEESTRPGAAGWLQLAIKANACRAGWAPRTAE